MSTSNPKNPPANAANTFNALHAIRYSLPEMLAELEMERASGSFSQEKLHQDEIAKLFEHRKSRHEQKK